MTNLYLALFLESGTSLELNDFEETFYHDKTLIISITIKAYELEIQMYL